MEIELREIAFLRSGDKGANVNIGVITQTEASYLFLKEMLSEEMVKRHFERCSPKAVERYLWPSLFSLNFWLEGVLEGGAGTNLRLDSQGKVFGVALGKLRFEMTKEKFEEIGR